MSIKSILAAHRSNLETGAGSSRDERLYFGLRGKKYPDVSRDTRNFIDRGDCESATPPTVRGETNDTLSNVANPTQSTVVAHGGANSFLVAKSIAAGTAGHLYFQDTNATNDMHGFLPGETVEFVLWLYIPSSGGPAASEMKIQVADYVSSWTETASSAAAVQDAWHKLTVRHTFSDSATGVYFRLEFASTAADTELVYYDDLEVHRYPTCTLAREDNLIDRGNCEAVALPGLLGETGIYDGTSAARDSTVARSGEYSIKHVTDGVTTRQLMWVDNASSTDMHGVVPGETVEIECYVYVPTTGGPSSIGEVYLSVQYYAPSAWTAVTVAATAYDSWVKLSTSVTIPTNATGFYVAIQIAAAASATEFYYVDDITVRRHSVPGTHYLSGGYTEHLVTLPDTFTLQIKFKPNFAFDVASSQFLLSWLDGGDLFRVIYVAAFNMFRVEWFEGVAVRSLFSAEYDAGTSFRNINQWITLTAAIDLTTGDATGSALWLNKTQDTTAWDGAIDAKTKVFNVLQTRADGAGTVANADIAYVRMFPDYVATDAEVQADFKDVKATEIFFPMDGHATGHERVNVSRYYTRQMSLTRSGKTGASGAYGANRFTCMLKNLLGKMSDDQYGTYDPTTDSFNGVVAESYLKERFSVELEDWYAGDFDSLFRGRITKEGLQRTSASSSLSFVSLVAEDRAADLAKATIRDGGVFEDCKLVDSVESNSLLHLVARLGRPKVRQYLANNSFEDATITDAWAQTGGTWTRDTSNPFFGAAHGRLVTGGTVHAIFQTVNFTGTEKLSVGQTFTFYVWLLSTAAAANATWNKLYFTERAAGTNDETTVAYTLAGGEGWSLKTITHTVTDATSTSLRVHVYGFTGDTIDIDGAMLIPGDSSLNIFRESSLVLNDAAASGTVSADYFDEIQWDEFGFDAGVVDYVHPWRRFDHDTVVWDHLKTLYDAIIVDYGGFDEAGTLQGHGVLEQSREDLGIQHLFTGSGTGYIRNNIEVGIVPVAANVIIGHGIKIIKHGRIVYKPAGNQTMVVASRVLWQASATDMFEESIEGLILNVSIPDDGYFPDKEEFPIYWARLGDTESKTDMFRRLWDRMKGGDLSASDAEQLGAMIPQGTGGSESFSMTGIGVVTGRAGFDASITTNAVVVWAANGPMLKLVGGEQLVGVMDADILHKLSDTAANGNSAMTEESLKSLTNGLDVTSRPKDARILLRNETGGAKVLIDAGIVGRPVTMLGDDSGYINSHWRLEGDIAKNGERQLEFGGPDILGDVREADNTANPLHVDVMCEYWKSYCFTKKHNYGFAQHGSRFWISPGQWGSIEVGAADEAEYLNSKIKIADVTITRSPDGVGTTSIRALEVEEGFKSTLTRDIAAFLSSGLKSRAQRSHVTVASKYHIGAADFRCSGTNDETTINAAIDFMGGAYGGGEVRLTEGLFVIDASLTPAANVTLKGAGQGASILEISIDDEIITEVATMGSEILGFKIKDLTLQATVGASHTGWAVRLDYYDELEISNVEISENLAKGFYLRFCDRMTITNLNIKGLVDRAISTEDCVSSHISTVKITSCAPTTNAAMIWLDGDYGNFSQIEISDITSTNAVTGIYVQGSYSEFEDILIKDVAGDNVVNVVYGIDVNRAGCMFSNVIIRNVDNTNTAAAQSGFHTRSSADSCGIASLIVTGCSGTGVLINSGSDNNSFGSGRTYSNGTDWTDNGTGTTTGAFQTS